MTSRLSGAGITVRLPTGWEGRINRHSAVAPLTPRTAAPPSGGAKVPREVTKPYVHLANYPLPSRRGTFGGGVVERMGPSGVFVSLVEYSSRCRDTALFAAGDLPRSLRPSMFDPNALQRTIPGQAGHQSFFTTAGRPFCLYVVLGSYRNAGSLVTEVNGVLNGISIGSG